MTERKNLTFILAALFVDFYRGVLRDTPASIGSNNSEIHRCFFIYLYLSI